METVSSPARKTLPQALPNFLAKNLRRLRKEQEWSQSELAERVGLNRGNIASYESGTAEPKICNLLRISNLFEVSTHDLTRLDLTDADNRILAQGNYQAADGRLTVDVEALEKRTEDIRGYVESVQQCYSFRMEKWQSGDKDLRTLAHYYEQMHEATQLLLKEQAEILQLLKCRC
ncbi:MAG: helix-turn-helix transcriptional regulator [Saprospiraceae bacterium]